MPHPFRWQPGDGQRHATRKLRPRGGFPVDAQIETLCGKQITADNSDVAWLWTTCPECNRFAHELTGTPIAPCSPGPPTG
ncbi:zinc finger protein [Saccharopolyspora shandongensis]|uniref:zinc finger protein n=1 Tax=Saccharopolyspora shandongensis TaxID=418495 RepID=UPI003431E082